MSGISTDTCLIRCLQRPRGLCVVSPPALLALQAPASRLCSRLTTVCLFSLCVLGQVPWEADCEMSLLWGYLSGMFSGLTPEEGKGTTQEWTEGDIGV